MSKVNVDHFFLQQFSVNCIMLFLQAVFWNINCIFCKRIWLGRLAIYLPPPYFTTHIIDLTNGKYYIFSHVYYVEILL